MNPTKTTSHSKPVRHNVWYAALCSGLVVRLGLGVLLWAIPGVAQPQQATDPQSPGRIIGTVLDQTGAAVAGARLTLAREDRSPNQDAISGEDGEFSFTNIAPGPFHLTIASPGFATQLASGVLHSGEVSIVPQIILTVASNLTEVRVEPSQIEIAEAQIKDEEGQRVFGVIPNFYVSYVSDAAPLTSKQKFKLAWKDTVDPVTFGITAAVAGIEQAADQYHGYGQGAQGYGKRYGAAYADLITSTYIGGAILPSLLKQDPRYFYRGAGSARTRVLYAIASAVICKGDNKRWQANYSGIFGDFASAGISNLYYPAKDTGVGLTFENALISTGAAAAGNIFQEFLVRKLTPNLPDRGTSKH